MNSKAILFRCLALGIAAAAILLWVQNRGAADKLTVDSSTAAALQRTTKPGSPAPVPSASARRKNESAVDAARLAHREIEASVHAKLQQWFRTTTGDTETQETLTKELLALLTDGNTREIIRALSPEELNTPFGRGALERWLKVDSAQAAGWLAARPDPTGEHAELVARRGLENPAELRAYCDQLPDGAWKQNVLNSASLEVVSKDPAAAVAFAQQMTPGAAKTNALETIAYDWFGRDLAAATQWTRTVEDPGLRERLLAVGAKAIATTDPDLAAGWLVTAVKTEGVLNETALGIVETWADQHPADAANWVARFSDAGPRKAAIDLLLSHWLKSDPAAANAWIQNLPDREIILAKLKAAQAEQERGPEKE
jgi:hypothetical protein